MSIIAEQNLVRVEGLWKKFARNNTARRVLMRESFGQAMTGKPGNRTLNKGEFWALKDVSFSIDAGDSLAVLGLNGSGKSTLLRLMAGHAFPTQGRVFTMGSVSSFINLSTGLNLALSGRDNIFLKGSLNGKSKKYMSALLDQIIDFSELDDFIDAPVNTYSSGMRLRLAFAVGIHDAPDILLVDEVLAVGDFRFKQKCLAAIQAMKSECAIVLVSHSMNDVRRFCDRAIVLDGGQIGHSGDVPGAIEYYTSRQAEEEHADKAQPFEAAQTVERTFHDDQAISAVQTSTDGVSWTRETQTLTTTMQSQLRLGVRFELHQPVENLVIGIPIRTTAGDVITAFSSETGLERFPAGYEGKVEVWLDIDPLELNPGRYNVILSVVDGPRFLHRSIAVELSVTESGQPYWGHYSQSAAWSHGRW